MQFTGKLARGLAATAAVLAVGAGSILAAAPASAATQESTLGVYDLTFAPNDIAPGQTGVLSYNSQPSSGPREGYYSITGQSWLQVITLPRGLRFDFDASAACERQSNEFWHYKCEEEFSPTTRQATGTFTVTRVGADEHNSWPGIHSFAFTVKATSEYVPGGEATVTFIPAATDTASAPTRQMKQTITIGKEPAPSYEFAITSPGHDVALEPGSVVDFEGTGTPGEAVEITDADGVVIGTGVVDENGRWTAPVTVPAVAEGNGGDLTVTVSSGEERRDHTVLVGESANTPVMNGPIAAGVGAVLLAIFAGAKIRRRSMPV